MDIQFIAGDMVQVCVPWWYVFVAAWCLVSGLITLYRAVMWSLTPRKEEA